MHESSTKNFFHQNHPHHHLAILQRGIILYGLHCNRK